MNSINHFLIFDLDSIGAAYSLINSYADGEVIHILSIETRTQKSVGLILASNDLIALKVVEGESKSFFRNNITNNVLIENMPEDIYQAYFEKKSDLDLANLLVVEFESISEVFKFAAKAVQNQMEIVSVQALASGFVLNISSESLVELNKLMQDAPNKKATLIENIKPALSELL